MARTSSYTSVGWLALDRSGSSPLHRQLYDQLREAILSGRLRAGVRLPPTRALAAELDVSRNTVLAAYEQLVAEGYLEARVGAGTFVTRALPEEVLHLRGPSEAPPPSGPGGGSTPASVRLSRRGKALASTQASVLFGDDRPGPFRPGVPALDAFPMRLWERLTVRCWRRLSTRRLAYGPPAGHPPLREALADYLRVARGVRCSAEQVLIVSGAQQAIDLAARVLLDPGDPVWMEDPGYTGTRSALLGGGARLLPIPIDEEGLDVTAGLASDPGARMVYVTPSHQYPLGVTMSLGRRLRLLEWAATHEAWILEDDYDSEYRYGSQPIPSLQGLDTAGRVIYVGTFSKVLFPGLRLGYLVVPPGLVSAFSAVRALSDRCPPVLPQAVLTDFITEGHFARHIRRMRTLYAARQNVLVEATRTHLSDFLTVESSDAGMHLIGWLSEDMDDRRVSRLLAEHDVVAPPVSAYAMGSSFRPGLVLGYAAVDEQEIRDAVERARRAMEAYGSEITAAET